MGKVAQEWGSRHWNGAEDARILERENGEGVEAIPAEREKGEEKETNGIEIVRLNGKGERQVSYPEHSVDLRAERTKLTEGKLFLR